MSLPVWRSDEAQRDVELQADYYAQRESLELALDFTLSVERTCAALAATPSLGPFYKHKLKDARLGKLRKWRVDEPFEKHLIFYRVDQDAIAIVRIIHGMRDLPRRLLEPPDVE